MPSVSILGMAATSPGDGGGVCSRAARARCGCDCLESCVESCDLLTFLGGGTCSSVALEGELELEPLDAEGDLCEREALGK